MEVEEGSSGVGGWWRMTMRERRHSREIQAGGRTYLAEDAGAAGRDV